MKDKTHAMNGGYSADEMRDGFDKLPDAEMASSRQRKNRQLNWANLEDNTALAKYENTLGMDQDMDGGFLPRNNYEDRN